MAKRPEYEKKNRKGGRDSKKDSGKYGDLKNKKIRREPKIDLSRFAGSSDEEDNTVVHTRPRNPKRVKKALANANNSGRPPKKVRKDAAQKPKEDDADDETSNNKTISFLKTENSNPSSTTEKKEEISQKKQKPGEKRLRGGVGVKEITIGKGAEVKNGARVSITYTGSFPSNHGKKGKVFDKNLNPNDPLQFVLGAGEVVPGLEIGMKGMNVGGERMITIPPALGYGSKGAPPDIPGGATLQFEVKLVAAGKGGRVREF
jgi:FK506-binding nuclear protein